MKTSYSVNKCTDFQGHFQIPNMIRVICYNSALGGNLDLQLTEGQWRREVPTFGFADLKGKFKTVDTQFIIIPADRYGLSNNQRIVEKPGTQLSRVYGSQLALKICCECNLCLTKEFFDEIITNLKKESQKNEQKFA